MKNKSWMDDHRHHCHCHQNENEISTDTLDWNEKKAPDICVVYTHWVRRRPFFCFGKPSLSNFHKAYLILSPSGHSVILSFVHFNDSADWQFCCCCWNKQKVTQHTFHRRQAVWMTMCVFFFCFSFISSQNVIKFQCEDKNLRADDDTKISMSTQHKRTFSH